MTLTSVEMTLTERCVALERALHAGGAELDSAVVSQARQIIHRSSVRAALGNDYTIVAVAGPTGSGKSSVVNALVGAPVAVVSARRPTTSTPLAVLWPPGNTAAVAEWLQLPARQVSAADDRTGLLNQGARAPDLSGLVLVDLPDADSAQTLHRREADRLLACADVVVWVVDPQKYADHRWHHDYVQQSPAENAQVVVLNQRDRLTALELDACVRDIHRLLAAEGRSQIPVVATSATTGEGLSQLRSVVAQVVQQRSAAAQRTTVEITQVACALSDQLGDVDPQVSPADVADISAVLVALSGAANLAHQSATAYRKAGWGATQLPLARWVPSKVSSDSQTSATVSAVESPDALADRAELELAVRAWVVSVADQLPLRWAEAIRAAAPQLPDNAATVVPAEVDAQLRAVVHRVNFSWRRPWWWSVVTVVLWVAWGGLVTGWFWWSIRALSDSSRVSLLTMLGYSAVVVAGMYLLSWGCRVRIAHSALQLRAEFTQRLDRAVHDVTQAWMVPPVRRVLVRLKDVRRYLTLAACPTGSAHVMDLRVGSLTDIAS